MPQYVDIHTHLNTAAFKDDYREVATRAFEAGVSMLNVGTMHATSERALELAHEFAGSTGPRMYAAVGLHPVHTSASYHDVTELGEGGKAFTSKGEQLDYDVYRTLALDPSVVAIGECGLDYYRQTDEESKKKQIHAFEQQIALANELNKPLMLHLRSGAGGNAYKDAYDILKRQAHVRGNSHFFAGSYEDAKRYWDMDYSTSFTGVITFTRDYDEVIKAVPAHLIHAETDAPYVTPKPYRGTRNEPAYVVEVVQRMAELRGEPIEVWAAQLTENARTMFAVPCGR